MWQRWGCLVVEGWDCFGARSNIFCRVYPRKQCCAPVGNIYRESVSGAGARDWRSDMCGRRFSYDSFHGFRWRPLAYLY